MGVETMSKNQEPTIQDYLDDCCGGTVPEEECCFFASAHDPAPRRACNYNPNTGECEGSCRYCEGYKA